MARCLTEGDIVRNCGNPEGNPYEENKGVTGLRLGDLGAYADEDNPTKLQTGYSKFKYTGFQTGQFILTDMNALHDENVQFYAAYRDSSISGLAYDMDPFRNFNDNNEATLDRLYYEYYYDRKYIVLLVGLGQDKALKVNANYYLDSLGIRGDFQERDRNTSFIFMADELPDRYYPADHNNELLNIWVERLS